MILKKLIFVLTILVFYHVLPSIAQDQDSIKIDLFSLYESTSDQEGMFYLPEIKRGGPLSNARIVNEKRLQTATKIGNYRGAATAASNLAWMELESGNNEKALAFFNIALDARKQLDDVSAIATIQLQIGYVYYRNLEYEEALRQFELALKKLEESKAAKSIPVTQALIAQAHLSMKNFDKARVHFLKAYGGFSSIGEAKAKARIGVQLAEIAIRKNEDAEALRYLDGAFAAFQKAGDKNGMALVCRDYGIIHFKKGDYQNAISEYRKSIAFSNQLSVAKLLKDTYLKLFTILSLNGEHDKSNEINIFYVQLRDSIDLVERSRVMNSQMTRRDLVERESIQEMLRKGNEVSYQQLTTQEIEKNLQLTEAEIERLEKEKIIEDLNIAKRISDQANMEREERIQQLTAEKSLQDLALSKKELEVSRGQTVRNTLLTAFLFIIIIAVLLFTRYRNQKKSHAKLDMAYKDLSETHHKLIAAQEQLVHAQKMASLGQLTAGIAHEIQNPLNFVNNFSELSMELIDEMKQPGINQDEILHDLKSNLEKINTHGKRADKIVKGMLTHSRAGQTEKQLTDINKMIDELLELSYHGNRSRDTNFTSEIIKNFDLNLPLANVSTQEISRVLINLFNNAFYAVGQRVKKEGSTYKASVGVSTGMQGIFIVIKIRDNGPGIPEDIRKKIFDPFFTTKPAGEGTGLGLSLSYDIIVKGHSGIISVNSEPNMYTEFTISIPVT
ncbi:MAG TPA: ATP-binding protein [Bacteroidia bacterium]|nr:ATP-binding protein [Bacteroidia bacterium]